MQRLAIFTLLSVALVAWMALQQRRLVAFQTEPQTPQQVPDDSNRPAADESDPDAPATDGAQPANPAPLPPDPAVVAAAEKLLRDARDRLYASTSVRANFVERANIGSRRFSAQGTYLSGKFPRLRLEYRVQIGGSEGELIEVCDGNILRTSKIIRPIDGDSSEPTISQWSRKDVAQIISESYIEGTPEAAILQAELSLGGLPTLLASMEQTMTFDTIHEQVWMNRPTVIIEGTWRREMLQRISTQLGASTQSLAQFLPERVRLYIDKETLFPKRILYRKLASQNPDVYVSLMSIEFTEIALNKGVDPEEFRYVPPKGVDEIDETGVYLNLIQQMRRPQAANPSDDDDATGPQPDEPLSPAVAPEEQPASP